MKVAVEGFNILSSQGMKVSTTIGNPKSMDRRVHDVWQVAGLDPRLPLCSLGCVPSLCIEFVAVAGNLQVRDTASV